MDSAHDMSINGDSMNIPPRAFPPAHTVAAEVVEEYAQNMMNEGVRLSEELRAVKAENARYRTALEYYADENNYSYIDSGEYSFLCLNETYQPNKVAREALPPKPEGEPDAE